MFLDACCVTILLLIITAQNVVLGLALIFLVLYANDGCRKVYSEIDQILSQQKSAKMYCLL